MNNILVSSTNNIGIDSLFIIVDKSFIYNRNSRGPKMENCGTPCLIYDHLEIQCYYTFVVY